MLRPSYRNRAYLKQFQLFLSSSARNKKYDDEPSFFDFSGIHDAIKQKSLKPIIDDRAFPIILISIILIFMTTLYIIIAAFSSTFLLNYESKPSTTPSTEYDGKLIIEIEEVLSKLMELKKNGNMKEYEAFLQPTMQTHCLNHLGSSYLLDIDALESFHMNLAEMISFIAAGNKLTEHKSLMVTYLGGIIDPSNSKEPHSIINSAKSCPLLAALYKLGAVTKSDKDIGDNVDNEQDSDTKFDHEYSWKNMIEFIDLIGRIISYPGQCLRIANELKKENMKAFIMNFYEMVDIIGKESKKEEDDGVTDLDDFVQPDPNSPDYKKYVFGRDGGIYQTGKYDDVTNDEYFRCDAFERILNQKFVLDENLSYTNLKIAIDEVFDEWYEEIQEAIN